jgi:hypothetical protein
MVQPAGPNCSLEDVNFGSFGAGAAQATLLRGLKATSRMV